MSARGRPPRFPVVWRVHGVSPERRDRQSTKAAAGSRRELVALVLSFQESFDGFVVF